MSKSNRVLSGMDTDTDAVVTALRDLADGIESNDILLKRLTTAHTAEAEDASGTTLMLRYIFTHEYDGDDPIQYAIPDGED